MDNEWRLGEVELAETLYLFDDDVGGVEFGSCSVDLTCGNDFAGAEVALCSECDEEDGCIAADAFDIDAVGCAEVA